MATIRKRWSILADDTTSESIVCLGNCALAIDRRSFGGVTDVQSLARPSFFRMFDLLVGQSNPGLKRTRWTHDGAEFERERHSFTSARHGIVIDIVTISLKGRRGWSLMVTKEYWWGPDDKPFKNIRWARPLSGQRGDLLTWLRSQESALERTLSQQLGHELHGLEAGDSPPTSNSDWTIDDDDDR